MKARYCRSCARKLTDNELPDLFRKDCSLLYWPNVCVGSILTDLAGQHRSTNRRLVQWKTRRKRYHDRHVAPKCPRSVFARIGENTRME
jgi:hypothetical protein